MQKELPVMPTPGLTTVYDLNDVLCQLWNLIPPADNPDLVAKIEDLLHGWICIEQDPDCWICQTRFLTEMDGLMFDDQPEPSKGGRVVEGPWNTVAWLNGCINANQWAHHHGLELPYNSRDLQNMHGTMERTREHNAECALCLHEATKTLAGDLRPEHQERIAKRGFKIMLDWFDVDSDIKETT